MGRTDFVTLESAMVRDWLNLQVKNLAMRKESYVLNGTIRLVEPDDRVHVYSGIALITELLGLKLKEKHDKYDYLYPWEYSFMYQGTEFYQIERERLEKYAEKTGQGILDGQVPADAGTD